MELKGLYELYGQLSIQAEIMNNRIMEVKKQIAEKLKQQPKLEKIEKESKK